MGIVPKAAMTIDYRQDNEFTLWIPRILGIVGIVLGSMRVITLPLGVFASRSFMYIPTPRELWAIAISLGIWISFICLVVGSAQCLGRSMIGRTLLLIYAYGHLICLAVAIGETVWWTFGMTGYGNFTNLHRFGILAYSVTRNADAAAYPAFLILLLRRPEIRGLFRSR
jgi:hypothetical protein